MRQPIYWKNAEHSYGHRESWRSEVRETSLALGISTAGIHDHSSRMQLLGWISVIPPHSNSKEGASDGPDWGKEWFDSKSYQYCVESGMNTLSNKIVMLLAKEEGKDSGQTKSDGYCVSWIKVHTVNRIVCFLHEYSTCLGLAQRKWVIGIALSKHCGIRSLL